ncbi:hypothetical protein [Zhongshania sp.]|uniref:hypothetical protein n=1 Tax=Zhongshania sp. TaxID=1971902 RepID=UPI003564CA4A
MSDYIFEDYSDSAERELALLLGKVTHHIHPEIVFSIQKENEKFRQEFERYCSKKINLESFFYEKSDCVFPGFRRPVNFEKIKGVRALFWVV